MTARLPADALTLAMFPVLVAMYARLARKEEADTLSRFGDEYRRYAARTPRFVPILADRPQPLSSDIPPSSGN